MPTYFARSTAIELSKASLAATSSIYASNLQSPQTTAIIREAQSAFAKASSSQTLMEEGIRDTHSESSLRFLGPGKNMPYRIVHVGLEVKTISADGCTRYTGQRQTKRPSRIIDAEAGITKPQKHKHVTLNASTALIAPSTTLLEHQRLNNKLEMSMLRTGLLTEQERRPAQGEGLEALSINVLLTPLSFASSVAHVDSQGKRNSCDLQIMVYLNGVLASVFFVPARYASEENLATKQSVRLTGTRVGRMVEKPWTIGPPPSRRVQSSPHSARERWLEISQSLQKEVATIAKSPTGNLPVSAEVLEQLANMDCPEELGSHGSFGCVDVLILSGRGAKYSNGVRYTTAPERMDSTFRRSKGECANSHLKDESAASAQHDRSKDSPCLSEIVQLAHSLKSTIRPTKFAQASEVPTIDASSIQVRMDGPIHSTDAGQYSTDTSLMSLPVRKSQSPNSGRQGSSPLSSIATDELLKSPLLDPKPASTGSVCDKSKTTRLRYPKANTSANQVSITTKTQNTISSTPSRPPSRSTLRLTSTAQPAASHSSVRTRSGRMSLTLRPPKPPAEIMAQIAGSSSNTSTTKHDNPLLSHDIHQEKSINNASSRKRQRQEPAQTKASTNASRTGDSSSQQPKTNRPPQAKALASSPLDQHFRVPPQSQDCVIGYAPAGIVRNVPAVKRGWFEEEDMVFGCRFIVS